jgi:UDP-GlcNAc:undecaprenyl-phosphate GlcNAc-1-phosphate transferase
MGDSGSLFVGFLLSTLPIMVFRYIHPERALLYGASLVVIPIMDTMAAIIRRKRRKQPFYSPDMQHVHHKLLTFGYTNHTTLVMLTGATTLAGFFAFLWVRMPGRITEYLLLLVWVGVVIFFIVIHYINKRIQAASARRGEKPGLDKNPQK